MEIYLQSYGARLRVKDGLFEVVVPDLTGSNHHVTDQFAAHQVQSILLQAGTSVSADALLLALESDTDIIVLDALGNPTGRFWTNRPSFFPICEFLFLICTKRNDSIYHIFAEYNFVLNMSANFRNMPYLNIFPIAGGEGFLRFLIIKYSQYE